MPVAPASQILFRDKNLTLPKTKWSIITFSVSIWNPSLWVIYIIQPLKSWEKEPSSPRGRFSQKRFLRGHKWGQLRLADMPQRGTLSLAFLIIFHNPENSQVKQWMEKRILQYHWYFGIVCWQLRNTQQQWKLTNFILRFTVIQNVSRSLLQPARRSFT